MANTIPQAQFIEVGVEKGQLPSLDFGHYCYQYFDIEVWHDVIHRIIETSTP